jgi:hypothetical protein
MAGLTTASTDPVAPQAADATPPAAEDAEERPTLRRRTAVGAFYVALAAAVLPVLVAAVRASVRGWVPTSDMGYLAIRAWDVLSRHPPLVGSPASASDGVGREIYQPGALQYDLLAFPVRLIGRGPGTAVTIALVNIMAIVGVAWLLRRAHGIAAATIGLAAMALLAWSMGSELLYDPWPTYSPLFALVLLLVAVWCAVAGEVVALPVLVVTGSYVAQVHLSFGPMVAGLVGFTAIASAVTAWRRRRQDPAGWSARRRRLLRWWSIALVVGLLCWAQPLAQQFFGPGEGNLGALVRSGDSNLHHPGVSDALRVLGGILAVPPAWLAPSFGAPSFDPDGDGRPLLLATAALVALLGAVAVLGWRALRRGSTTLAAAAATVLVAFGLGFVSVLRMPLTYGLTPHYLRWLWPLGLAVWVVPALGVIEELQAAARFRNGRAITLVGVGAAAVAVVGGVAALPTVDNGTTSPRWSVEAVQDLAPDVVAAVDEWGPVLVDLTIDWPTIFVGPPLLGELQDAGIPFQVDQRILARQVGFHREAQAGETYPHLSVRGGPAQPQAGEEVVASWSSLSEDDRAELERLGEQLTDVIGHVGVPLRSDAAATYRALGRDDHLAALRDARRDPDQLVTTDILWSAVRGDVADYAGHSLVDDASLPRDARRTLARWSELAERRDRQQVTVYLTTE